MATENKESNEVVQNTKDRNDTTITRGNEEKINVKTTYKEKDVTRQ